MNFSGCFTKKYADPSHWTQNASDQTRTFLVWAQLCASKRQLETAKYLLPVVRQPCVQDVKHWIGQAAVMFHTNSMQANVFLYWKKCQSFMSTFYVLDIMLTVLGSLKVLSTTGMWLEYLGKAPCGEIQAKGISSAIIHRKAINFSPLYFHTHFRNNCWCYLLRLFCSKKSYFCVCPSFARNYEHSTVILDKKLNFLLLHFAAKICKWSKRNVLFWLLWGVQVGPG